MQPKQSETKFLASQEQTPERLRTATMDAKMMATRASAMGETSNLVSIDFSKKVSPRFVSPLETTTQFTKDGQASVGRFLRRGTNLI